MGNSKFVAMWLIVFFGLFILVHRDGFAFANAMVYHAYNFIGGSMALFLVFLFFYKYRSAFEENHKIGKALQYIGRHTLAIYMLHYFFLPRNLQFIGDFFMQYSNPTIELFISILIAALVIGISLLTNALICTSPLLAHYLFGERTNQIQDKT